MKKGISLVALVITIIVLIILTAAVIWTGVDTPDQTKLAVFYNDVAVIQEAMSTGSLTKYLESALETDGENSATSKWVDILSGDQVTNKPINTILGDTVKLYYFKKGAGEKLGLGVNDAVMSEYAVNPETGRVYYIAGILATIGEDETIIYNRELSIDSTHASFATVKDSAVKLASYTKGKNNVATLTDTAYTAE